MKGKSKSVSLINKEIKNTCSNMAKNKAQNTKKNCGEYRCHANSTSLIKYQKGDDGDK